MAVFVIPVGWEILAGLGAVAAVILFVKTAQEIISEKKKGSINREFPGEWLDKTLKEIEEADENARKAKKLLNDKRFNK
jgi:bifunctional DNA-binding transcriptional regulator/antitoxin component of YhaV-PrlF toxin-antitoxin module